jgi:hypothetical protein
MVRIGGKCIVHHARAWPVNNGRYHVASPPMWDELKDWARDRPLQALTIIAIFPRLFAAFFSQGYFAHDDHFLVIEPAGSWIQASSYSTWLPWNQTGEPTPSGHSFFYVGLHYLLFKALGALGISDPKLLMVFVRFFHALWSIVVVRAGYRIALRLADPAIAWRTGLFLALLYFMPFLSVRNLVEVACIPFLMLGSFQLIRDEDGPGPKAALLAGIFIGLAVNIRFQTIFFAAGPGLALLFQRRWPAMISYGIGVSIPLIIIQGSLDMFIWQKPFVELTEYVRYNLEHTTTYGTLPWYNYLLLLAGIFIPPFSVALLFGFFRRTWPLTIWLSLLLFLAVHSYFPNKQERFLLPMVPLYFVLAYISWEQWRISSAWWRERRRLWNGVLTFTWVLNSIVLVVLCFSYSKRSRVEAMYMLRDVPMRGLIVEDTYEGDPPLPPLFYLGKWHIEVIQFTDIHTPLDSIYHALPEEQRPDIVLFFGKEELEERMARITAHTGPLTLIGRAEPGLVDKVVHWLNPVNRNETIVIARIEDP